MTDLLKELEAVVRAVGVPKYSEAHYEQQKWKALKLIVDHRAEIAQNAEDAKRLRTLEMAMGEWGEKKYVPAVDELCVRWLRLRADEIMREWGFDRTPERPK